MLVVCWFHRSCHLYNEACIFFCPLPKSLNCSIVLKILLCSMLLSNQRWNHHFVVGVGVLPGVGQNCHKMANRCHAELRVKFI